MTIVFPCSYDGDNVVADIQGGNIVASYVTPFLDQNVSMTIPTGLTNAGTYYYSQDGLGSVRTLTNASGVVVNKYDYAAFGETYAPGTSVTVQQRYTYTGRELNAVSGLMYYRYRTYDSAVGRFGGRDPAEYENNPLGNLYDYVLSNSIMTCDPFGLGEGSITIIGWENPDPKPGESPENAAKRVNDAKAKAGENKETGSYGIYVNKDTTVEQLRTQVLDKIKQMKDDNKNDPSYKIRIQIQSHGNNGNIFISDEDTLNINNQEILFKDLSSEGVIEIQIRSCTRSPDSGGLGNMEPEELKPRSVDEKGKLRRDIFDKRIKDLIDNDKKHDKPKRDLIDAIKKSSKVGDVHGNMGADTDRSKPGKWDYPNDWSKMSPRLEKPYQNGVWKTIQSK